jgi:hypothetical protein
MIHDNRSRAAPPDCPCATPDATASGFVTDAPSPSGDLQAEVIILVIRFFVGAFPAL